ncbi:MAG TPA: hypothetical protein DEG17_17405 [Cyanobacteria bacterium UBA11149]|nr:hypothetical protein [Cyanobacteria bacterium UBA11367]HBE59375.1 hypothetical protein [Cyanobacteria bacterium UBA11366]HBK62742.1 hypothetical protein [Cyanobacteria bacterium UBA11166]HBR73496.1 hypothetical protein [Cyanobacteria bacterium UBA11159]HBS71829.1 hypothetical protein [Cyanobacteria bacterium UBA11153]HBW90599.1 hypothetical protein [Cyanobacteria bacterium UBA11149]HCA94243.1 hypothetical protein [Cyanobacteria bacterium UBA9226]
MKRTSLIKVIFVSVILLSGICATNQDSLSTTLSQVGTEDAMTSKTSKLAQQLINREYGEFFTYPAHDKTIDAIWNTPGNPEALEALVNDKSAPTEARFLAADILFSRNFTVLLRTDLLEDLANIYAEALVNNYTENANSWGLLYEFNQSGPVGNRFLMMGEAALPVLVRLLDNESISVTYEGSETATIGNMYHFRVKDFAAFYISSITGIPVQFHREIDKRDTEIEKLKSLLDERFKNK